MKEKKSIMEKARILQNNIEWRVKDLPVLSLVVYFKFLCIVFFITGFMLLFYCILVGVHPLLTNILSCPFLYFGLGFISLFIFLFECLELRNKGV